MKELDDSNCFTYKQLSEEDKVWLEKARTLPTGTRIIRARDIPDWYYAQVLQFRIEKKEAQNKARREKYAQKKQKAINHNFL